MIRAGGARSYDPCVWDQVVALIAQMSVVAISKRPGMPTSEGIYRKLRTDPEFAARVTDARNGVPLKRYSRCRVVRDAESEDALWERVLAALEVTPIHDLCRQSDMPSIVQFWRKRRSDAAFDARARKIIERKEAFYEPVSGARWAAFILGLKTCETIESLCRLPGMPSIAPVYKRAKKDSQFRAVFASAIRRMRSHRIEQSLARRDAVEARRVEAARVRRTASEARRAEKDFARKVSRERKAAVKARRVRDAQPLGAIFKRQLSRDELYAAVAAVVPRGLPPITRDDIICDMVLAVLDGQLAVDDLKAQAKDYVREHWRIFGTLRDVSLDVQVFDGNATTRGDMLAGHGADYW